ncbi:MAG: hypothetical protein ISS31_05820 [Kiritimatiellae bacterium]|nr:hypothetical protein [Kiritimatiellia bacterium]
MKRVVALAAGMMVVASMAAAAQPLMVQGVREIGVSGMMDDNGEHLGLSLNGRYGSFVVDGIEAGVYGGVALRGSGDRNTSLGLFSEYNFDLGGPLVPHIGIGLGLGWSDIGIKHDSYIELEAWGGAKYFFIDYAAFGADVGVLYATEDIYNGYDDPIDWVLRLNTRWFF